MPEHKECTNELIWDELREFRADFNSWSRDMGERVSTVESHVKHGITGNGQPSRLQRMEDAVGALQQWRWQTVGFASAFSLISVWITWLIKWAFTHNK